MTNGNSAFFLVLYLTSVHFWGELQHLGEVSEQKFKWRPIRTREIGGVRSSEELIVESPFKNVAGFYAKPFMHVFFCKYCEIFKNTYFKKYLRKSASKCHCQICIHKSLSMKRLRNYIIWCIMFSMGVDDFKQT